VPLGLVLSPISCLQSSFTGVGRTLFFSQTITRLLRSFRLSFAFSFPKISLAFLILRLFPLIPFVQRSQIVSFSSSPRQCFFIQPLATSKRSLPYAVPSRSSLLRRCLRWGYGFSAIYLFCCLENFFLAVEGLCPSDTSFFLP